MVSFNFRRLLDTFVPGFIVVISIWYLFKPIINKYFPTIAFDPEINSNYGDLKIIILIVLSLFVGIIINHFSDIPISLLFPNQNSEKKKRIFKRIAQTLFGIISWNNNDDPRVYSIDRYLNSNRKEIFIKMLKEWGFSDQKKLKNNKEEHIIAHQHISTRLKTLNKLSHSIYKNNLEEVYFSSSLFTAVSVIFFLSIVAYIINSFFVENFTSNIKFIKDKTLLGIIVFNYFLLIILSYSLKRRFRHFSSQTLTIALHFFDKIKK